MLLHAARGERAELPINTSHCTTPLLSPGNENSDLRKTVPAACTAAIVVTALSAPSNAPASFSNWLPKSGASTIDYNRTIAAPGVNILSTVPSGALESWSGT